MIKKLAKRTYEPPLPHYKKERSSSILSYSILVVFHFGCIYFGRLPFWSQICKKVLNFFLHQTIYIMKTSLYTVPSPSRQLLTFSKFCSSPLTYQHSDVIPSRHSVPGNPILTLFRLGYFDRTFTPGGGAKSTP